jgi:predicted porin
MFMAGLGHIALRAALAAALGFVLLAAPSLATAGPPAAVTLEVGGYMEQTAGLARNQPGVRVARQGGAPAVVGAPNATGQRADSEIWFRGRGRIAGDVIIGFVVQLEADSQPDRQIDESYLFAEGRFGRLLLGAENDAAYLQHVSAPRAGAAWGVLESAATGWVHKPRHVAFLGTTAPLATGDDRKITWFTPRAGGVQLGLSLTPAQSETGRDVADRLRERTDMLSGSANGRWTMGETRLSVSAGWVHGPGAVQATTAERRAAIDDAALGAELRHRRIAVGAGFRRLANPGGPQHGRAIAAGVAWESGHVAAGFGILRSRTAGTPASLGADRGDLAVLSASYRLAPGAHLTGAVFAARFSNGLSAYGAEDRNRGHGAVSGLRLSF